MDVFEAIAIGDFRAPRRAPPLLEVCPTPILDLGNLAVDPESLPCIEDEPVGSKRQTEKRRVREEDALASSVALEAPGDTCGNCPPEQILIADVTLGAESHLTRFYGIVLERRFLV